jgi:hypothetical protein
MEKNHHTLPSTLINPTITPTAPIRIEGHTPTWIFKLDDPPVKYTYGVWLGVLAFANKPPIPPPVRLAPFG